VAILRDHPLHRHRHFLRAGGRGRRSFLLAEEGVVGADQLVQVPREEDGMQLASIHHALRVVRDQVLAVSCDAAVEG
jgi:hypothetical protein